MLFLSFYTIPASLQNDVFEKYNEDLQNMRIQIISFLLLTFLFSACEFEADDIQYNAGNDFIFDGASVLMIDTLTIKTYNVAVDSIITSRTKRFLTGKHVNNYGIETYCETYFRFDPTNVIAFYESSVYDSLNMILHFDGYKIGDTTGVAEFGVFRLTEPIKLDADANSIYSNQTFESEDEPLGTFQVDFSRKVDSVVFRLSDVLGEKLYNMAVQQSDSVNDKAAFQEYFRGVAIRPMNDDAAFVLGIKALADSASSPRMRVYYHDHTVAYQPYFDFPLEVFELYEGVPDASLSNHYAFNHISNNYEGTIIEGIESGEFRLPSTLTNNVSFMQGGAMLRTLIEIPGLTSLYNFGIGSIVKAELYFEPIYDTYSSALDLPNNLQMILVDQKNRFYDHLYITGTENIAYGALNYNRIFREETNYTYDITNYIKSEYEEIGDQLYSLVMYIPFDSQYPNIDQLIVGNPQNRDHRMKLKVYMTNY